MQFTIDKHIKTHASICLLTLAQMGWGNPSGGQVVEGDVSIQYGQQTVIHQQSGKAIVNWQAFGIDVDESTTFVQPDSQSVILNRVVGQDPSHILGQLSANGRVFLINPNGILFGVNARVDVGGLVASTSNISDQNFMNGNYIFDEQGSLNAQIINYGEIKTVTEQGLVALVAPTVENHGLIQATLGKVALASGDRWTLDLYGDNLITFSVTKGVPEKVFRVDNQGRISANGGVVFITAQSADDILESVINMEGYIEARTVENQQGHIVLLGDSQSIVNVAGELNVTGDDLGEVGGLIQITGGTVNIGHDLGQTILNASGDAGGGVIQIGGEAKGSGELPHAMKTVIEQNAQILADATGIGNGGEVIVWSDNETIFSGNIYARGGELGGNGGFVETSSKNAISVLGGMVTTLAPLGKAGVWLLDPLTYTINAAVESTILTGLANNAVFQIQADETITVENGYTFTWDNNNTLELLAGTDIVFEENSGITNTAAGSLRLRSDADANGSGSVTFNTGSEVDWTVSTGTVELFYNPSSYASPTDYSSYLNAAAGKATAFMLVNNLTDLQAVDNNLAGTYALGADIDATATSSMNDGAGFDPIGDADNAFTGRFDFNDYTIANVFIDRPNENNIGLFATSDGARFDDISMTNVSVTGNNFVGGFIARMTNGTILTNTSVQGTIVGNDFVGGIYGTLEESVVLGNTTGQTNVEGNDYVGGILGAGVNNIVQGNIFHTGTVTGSNYVGGLVGTFTRDVLIDGLVFHSGDVVGDTNVGGIVGVISGVGFDIDVTAGVGSINGNIVSSNGQAGSVIGSTDISNVNAIFADWLDPNLGGLSRYVGRELSNNATTNNVNNTTLNTNILENVQLDTSVYRTLVGDDGLFSYQGFDSDIRAQLAGVVFNSGNYIKEAIASNLIEGLFDKAFNTRGQLRAARFENSFVSNISASLQASNQRLSASGVMAMGTGIGGLLLSSQGGMLSQAFGQSMGANILAMLGVVSLSQTDGAVDVADARSITDSVWCGVTCKLVMLSMESPREMSALSGNLSVNSALYVNSSARPESEIEQRYTWDPERDAYVRTESLYERAESTSNTVIISYPM